MTIAAFASAVLALLLAPGPSNTLMGLAGAQRGLRRVLWLMPAELAGYLTTILPLGWLGAGPLAQTPVAAMALKLAASAWVMVLAVRLWSAPAAGDTTGMVTAIVTARQVYVTTLLNPKALVFGLVLLPPPQAAGFAARLALFFLLVAAAALAWGATGALLRNRGTRRLARLQRLASIWLATIAITLLAGAIIA
jgi:threonine/homoserine/homoserine lactone efflux protein